MSLCNFTTTINGSDCIGDSRGIINQNFINLDNAVCTLSSATDFIGIEEGGGLEANAYGRIGLSNDLKRGYYFTPVGFNGAPDPYTGRILATYSATNNISAPYTSPTQYVTVCPTSGPYSTSIPIDVSKIQAFLIKIKVKGNLQRQDGTLEVRVRRSASESPYQLLEFPAGGSSGAWSTQGTSTEIIYHDKSAGRFLWSLYDAGTGTLGGTATYNVSFEVLGFYYTIN